MKRGLEQGKWIYGGLAGFAIAFFLALLGSSTNLSGSPFLLAASLCFSITLPMHIAFCLLHAFFYEADYDEETVDSMVNSRASLNITYISYIVLYGGIASLVGHFSILVLGCLLLSSFWMAYEIITRILRLPERKNTSA